MKKKIAAVMTMAALATGCATSGSEKTVSVPEKLKPSAGEVLTLQTAATGAQVYECAAGKAGFEWVFKGPEAELFDRAGNRVGKHYGGPTWEANDGSKVVAGVKARDDAPDANAIPWLLLGAKSNAGTGVFSRTTSIQRVRTVGGTTPTAACGQAEAGKIARVAYAADYYFYSPRR